MYLAGISVRRIKDLTEALGDSKTSVGLISKLNKQIYEKIEAGWLQRGLDGRFPNVYLAGIVLKPTWSDEIRNMFILVAFGVNEDTYRAITGTAEDAKEDKVGWDEFLANLKERGLESVRLFISDKSMGLVESLAEYCPEALWPPCAVHFYRNVFTNVPHTKVREVSAMLKAIHA
jgi:transposase-like protein